MAVVCPSCGAHLSEDDLDRGLLIARCSACNTVFDCSASATGPSRAMQRRRPPVPMPPQFQIVEAREGEGGEVGYRQAPTRGGPPVTIVRRWYTPVAWFMAAFLVFWNAILYHFIFGSSNTPLFFRLFPLIHVAAGAYIAYWTLALFVNKTTIVVTDDEITVRHAPLPWPGNRRVEVSKVTQLFTEERVTQGKNGENRSYALSAVMEGGGRQEIVKGLPEPAQALFLEQKIESRLGIVDVEVGGEYKG